MTREEAIEYLKCADVTVGREVKTKTAEALEMAIDALVHEKEILDALRLSLHVQKLKDSILEEEKCKLDKIRAEIDEESAKSFKYPNWERAKALEWVLSIIDKYRKRDEE